MEFWHPPLIIIVYEILTKITQKVIDVINEDKED